MSITARRVTALAAAAVLLPSLSGCWSGFSAQTSEQANQAVGNGSNLATGDIQIRGAVWVRNVMNPSEATLVATFINNGDVPDKLTKVEITPTSPMGITGGAMEVTPGQSVRSGFWSTSFINAFNLQAFPSTFVPTTFTFENAGTVAGDVIAMPNTGQYAQVPVAVTEQQKLQEFAGQTETTDETTATEKVKKAKKKKAEAAAG